MTYMAPGLHKLMLHVDHLYKLKMGWPAAPIHVSVWPTLRCQFNCAYCCCRKTPKDGEKDLPIPTYKSAVDTLFAFGTKAIEFSGGGEPLLWDGFEEAVAYTSDSGMDVSLITNGLLLNKITTDVLSQMKWIRVSLQSVEHARKIDFGHVFGRTRISASFIAAPKNTNKEELEDLHLYAQKENLTVRIAVQQPASPEFTAHIQSIVEKLGHPFFFTPKEPGVPAGCYMAWIRAAINWRGEFLPCPAIQLSGDFEGTIPKSHVLCHVSKLKEWLINNPIRDLGFRCSSCNCGKEENDYLHQLLTGEEQIRDVNFV